MQSLLSKLGLWMGLFVLFVTGCSATDHMSSSAIDPPPKEVQNRYEKQVIQQSKPTMRNGLELYFLTDTNYVVPYSLNIPAVKGIAKEAMKFMVKGGPGESLLPKGFTCLLPQGTKIRGIDIRAKQATVDFSKEFLNYRPELEEKILNAVTWSLTGFPTVEKVNIRVEGKTLEMMPKRKTLTKGMTRSQGINLELAEGVNITQSMPVTLYFVGQTVDQQTYHVPVTRMVNRQERALQTTMEELIRGPLQGSQLIGPLDASVKLKRIELNGQTAMVDFNEELLQYEEGRAISQDAMAAIVFSLTENTTARQVKIKVNGAYVGVSGQKKEAEKSIIRPKQINPSKL